MFFIDKTRFTTNRVLLKLTFIFFKKKYRTYDCIFFDMIFKDTAPIGDAQYFSRRPMEFYSPFGIRA